MDQHARIFQERIQTPPFGRHGEVLFKGIRRDQQHDDEEGGNAHQDGTHVRYEIPVLPSVHEDHLRG
jgi:hypothetical protein